MCRTLGIACHILGEMTDEMVIMATNSTAYVDSLAFARQRLKRKQDEEYIGEAEFEQYIRSIPDDICAYRLA